MVLGIVLCGNIQFVIMLLFILMAVDVPIKGALFSFFVGMVFFTWILTIASILMNVMFIKWKRYFYKRNYIGLAFSIVAHILCLAITVLAILIRQRWIEPDFITSRYNVYQYLIWFIFNKIKRIINTIRRNVYGRD